jgi:hypothetical protein
MTDRNESSSVRQTILERIRALRDHVQRTDLPEGERDEIRRLLDYWQKRLSQLNRPAA